MCKVFMRCILTPYLKEHARQSNLVHNPDLKYKADLAQFMLHCSMSWMSSISSTMENGLDSLPSINMNEVDVNDYDNDDDKLRSTMHILPIMEGCPGMIGCMLSTVYSHTQGCQHTRNVLERHLSKIILFVDFRKSVIPNNMTDIEGYIRPGVYALVQTQEEQPMPVQNSVLLSTCTLSNDFYLVLISSFSKLAFVVDNVGCGQKSLLGCNHQWMSGCNLFF
jgi:hypothetical protein